MWGEELRQEIGHEPEPVKEETPADWMSRDTGDYEAGGQPLRDPLKELERRDTHTVTDVTRSLRLRAQSNLGSRLRGLIL